MQHVPAWFGDSSFQTCAVGDIHGDLQKAVSLFKLAGCVEEVDRRLVWTGGNTTVVQLGDVLDRGSQEIGGCCSLWPAVYKPRLLAVVRQVTNSTLAACSWHCSVRQQGTHFRFMDLTLTHPVWQLQRRCSCSGIWTHRRVRRAARCG